MVTNESWDRITGEHTFELILLTQTPYADLPERTVITFATIWLDWDIRSHIVQFNRTNPTYRIHVIDYTEFATEDDWQAGLTRLSTDIIAGKVPDILDVSNLPFKQYVARNLLEDLYPFIDSDPELSRSDFMESAFRAAEMDGGLHRVFSSFGINTVVGNPAVLGASTGWTMDEFLTVLNANPQADMPMGQWLTKDSFLQSIIMLSMDEYVDWAAGEVFFDTGGFAQLLEFSNMFPEDFEYDRDFYVDENELVAMGRQIMSPTGVGDFQTIQMYQAMYGGDIVYKGFPNENRNGNSLNINTSLSITTSSNNKDGAWEFIRTILTSDWQRSNIWWNFPTNKVVFNEKVEEAMREDEESGGISTGGGQPGFGLD
jgi:ABC-type glycerol-3-phosphate transport system substrate-binding protein